MSRPLDDFRRSYLFAFRRYVENPSETLLRAAYELGREAVAGRLSVLELAEVHHDAMLSALGDRPKAAPEDIVGSAREFLLESLSSFEMMERAAADVRHAAATERRQAAIVRRLSDLLTDASVAESQSSLHEVLRLVAEQARELLAADCCTIRLTSPHLPAAVESAADDA